MVAPPHTPRRSAMPPPPRSLRSNAPSTLAERLRLGGALTQRAAAHTARPPASGSPTRAGRWAAGIAAQQRSPRTQSNHCPPSGHQAAPASWQRRGELLRSLRAPARAAPALAEDAATEDAEAAHAAALQRAAVPVRRRVSHGWGRGTGAPPRPPALRLPGALEGAAGPSSAANASSSTTIDAPPTGIHAFDEPSAAALPPDTPTLNPPLPPALRPAPDSEEEPKEPPQPAPLASSREDEDALVPPLSTSMDRIERLEVALQAASDCTESSEAESEPSEASDDDPEVELQMLRLSMHGFASRMGAALSEARYAAEAETVRADEEYFEEDDDMFLSDGESEGNLCDEYEELDGDLLLLDDQDDEEEEEEDEEEEGPSPNEELSLVDDEHGHEMLRLDEEMANSSPQMDYLNVIGAPMYESALDALEAEAAAEEAAEAAVEAYVERRRRATSADAAFSGGTGALLDGGALRAERELAAQSMAEAEALAAEAARVHARRHSVGQDDEHFVATRVGSGSGGRGGEVDASGGGHAIGAQASENAAPSSGMPFNRPPLVARLVTNNAARWERDVSPPGSPPGLLEPEEELEHYRASMHERGETLPVGITNPQDELEHYRLSILPARRYLRASRLARAYRSLPDDTINASEPPHQHSFTVPSFQRMSLLTGVGIGSALGGALGAPPLAVPIGQLARASAAGQVMLQTAPAPAPGVEQGQQEPPAVEPAQPPPDGAVAGGSISQHSRYAPAAYAPAEPPPPQPDVSPRVFSADVASQPQVHSVLLAGALGALAPLYPTPAPGVAAAIEEGGYLRHPLEGGIAGGFELNLGVPGGGAAGSGGAGGAPRVAEPRPSVSSVHSVLGDAEPGAKMFGAADAAQGPAELASRAAALGLRALTNGKPPTEAARRAAVDKDFMRELLGSLEGVDPEDGRVQAVVAMLRGP